MFMPPESRAVETSRVPTVVEPCRIVPWAFVSPRQVESIFMNVQPGHEVLSKMFVKGPVPWTLRGVLGLQPKLE